MSKRILFHLVGLSLCLTTFIPTSTAEESILYHGKIFTADPQHPYAEAVAIRDGKIVAVGSRQQVTPTVSQHARLVDLKEHFLLPGLIDSHCHAIMGGQTLVTADYGEQNSSIDELVKFAAESRTNGRGLQGGILTITGLPLEFWSQIPQLNERFNAVSYSTQPVLLKGMDWHTSWANKTLLKRAGINKAWIESLAPADRAYYGFTADFEPNGFLVDKAQEKLAQVLPKTDARQLLAAGRAAVDYLHALGITAWLDPSAKEETLAAYRELSIRGELQSHVAALPVIDFKQGDPDKQLAQALTWRDQFKNAADFKIVGIKVFADGVLEYPSQTAVLSKPYKNSGKNGELLFDPAAFARIATEADKQGLLVHVHAIGDQAVTEALNGIATARKVNGNSGIPHTITHLQLVRPGDISRFRELGVVASFQLLWASAEADTLDLVQPYIDPALYAWQYPARSILDAGGIVAGASDWPVSTANVFRAIYQAETRKGSRGILDASQRVPREAMLYAYTRNAAVALRLENRIGSIEAGKQADFTLLDHDVLTVSDEEVRDTRILWTVFSGKTVYGVEP